MIQNYNLSVIALQLMIICIIDLICLFFNSLIEGKIYYTFTKI